jgi:hypothetical protein
MDSSYFDMWGCSISTGRPILGWLVADFNDLNIIVIYVIVITGIRE